MKITILTICLLLFASKAFAYETQEEKNLSWKYVVCYGQMTNEHKRSGLHRSNRMKSIKIKEKTCEDYAEGRIFYYPGKR